MGQPKGDKWKVVYAYVNVRTGKPGVSKPEFFPTKTKAIAAAENVLNRRPPNLPEGVRVTAATASPNRKLDWAFGFRSYTFNYPRS